MRPITVHNQTRRIGESQGYIGLSVRDERINDTVTGPGTPCMTTWWRPSPEERRALIEGGDVRVRIIGIHHPPIMVGVVGLEEEAAMLSITEVMVLRQAARATTADGWVFPLSNAIAVDLTHRGFLSLDIQDPKGPRYRITLHGREELERYEKSRQTKR